METNTLHQHRRLLVRGIDQPNVNRTNLMKDNFLARFVLFFVFLRVVLSVSPVEETFPQEKCETALLTCQCEDYGDVVGIECHNMTNFESFARILSDGSVFEVNTTFEIALSGAQVLPRSFLKGLIVRRLLIDDAHTEVVSDGAFDGAWQLDRFQVILSSIKEIPDLHPVQDSLQKLNLDGSLLQSISGDKLKNLSNLQVISFSKNSIQSVSQDAFQGTENLVIFDLSYNKLTSLPPHLFSSWKKLKKVVLTSNQLVHVDQLFAVTHPILIYLDHNNLTDLDSVLHPNMHKVQTLLLSHNPLTKITENSFNGKVSNAHFVYMDHCLIREFNASHFRGMSLLSTLDLSYNLIEKITNQSIQFGNNLELHFTGNKMKEFGVDLTYRVKYVYLNKNLLTSVGPTFRYSQIMEANMAENRIVTLGPDDFREVHGIQSIGLQGNLISEVDPLTFKGLRKDLVHLDLSRNQLRSLQGCVRDLFFLTSLNLSGNMIESFAEDEFQFLEELVELYLDGNLLTTLGNALQSLTHLHNLIISNNRMLTLNPEHIPQTVKYLSVEGNPIKCDCQLLPLLQFLNSSSVETDGPLCVPSNRTIPVPPAKCPEGCRCSCSWDRDQHFVSVDCSSSGLVELPHIFTSDHCSTNKENCTSMTIHLLRDTHFAKIGAFVIEDEIGGLNLTNNNLASLEEAHFPNQMRLLLLGNNHLQAPPVTLLNSLENLNNVTLFGNPWTCDCGSLKFKEWILYKSEIVMDANGTRCGSQFPELAGRVIWSVPDIDLCPVYVGSSTLLVVGLLCVFLVLGVFVVVLVIYWTKVKLWLVERGITWLHEDGANQRKEFENIRLLPPNWQENIQSISEATFPLPDDEERRVLEFQGDSDNSFQERPSNQLSTGKYINLTAQSMLPM